MWQKMQVVSDSKNEIQKDCVLYNTYVAKGVTKTFEVEEQKCVVIASFNANTYPACSLSEVIYFDGENQEVISPMGGYKDRYSLSRSGNVITFKNTWAGADSCTWSVVIIK